MNRSDHIKKMVLQRRENGPHFYIENIFGLNGFADKLTLIKRPLAMDE